MASSDERQGDHRAGRWTGLALILLAGLAARGVALWAGRDVRLVLDEQLYKSRAEALLDGQGFLGSFQSWVRHPASLYIAELPQYPGAYQPPMYPLFMAGVMGLTGRSILAVKIVQILLSTLTIGIVYGMGRAWFDHTRGLIAAAICAFYPNLIAFSHYLWSETLYTFLFVLAAWLLTRRRELITYRAAILAGILIGAAALTRAAIVYFLPLLLLWLIVVHRRRLGPAAGRAAIVAIMAFAVILPWTIRNYRVLGGFVLIDSNGPSNFWRGNAGKSFAARPAPPELSYKFPFRDIPLFPVGQQIEAALVDSAKQLFDVLYPTDLQIMATAQRLALDYIWEDIPGFFDRAVYKIIDLWNPTSFLIRHFRFGAYGPVSPFTEAVIAWTAILSYVAVMILGIIGWLHARREPAAVLLLLLMLFFTAIHAVTFGLTRFRLPLMPLIIVFAAHGLYVKLIRREGAAAKPAA